MLNHRKVIAYSVLSFGEDHKVCIAPLRFILSFGRGLPFQVEVQGSELYDKIVMYGFEGSQPPSVDPNLTS